jgi:hypothetical protein
VNGCLPVCAEIRDKASRPQYRTFTDHLIPELADVPSNSPN